MHASHAVVKLPSANDAAETVRLLKDHEFRDGIYLSLVVTGVQPSRPKPRPDPLAGSSQSMRSSQLPTPPPNLAAGSVDSEEIEIDEVDTSEDERPIIRRAAAPRHAVAGPGPSTSVAVATAAARREVLKKLKVARPRRLPDSDSGEDDEAAMPQRAPPAKRSRGDAASDGSSGSFSLSNPKARLSVRDKSDRSRRMLVDKDLLIHASMRG